MGKKRFGGGARQEAKNSKIDQRESSEEKFVSMPSKTKAKCVVQEDIEMPLLEESEDEDVDRRPSKSQKKNNVGSDATDCQEKPTDSNIEAYARFLKDLFILNKVSGKDAHQVAALSEAAGAQGVENLSKSGNKGFQEGNFARDLKRACNKDSSMPEPYWAHVPTHNPKTGKNMEFVWLPFLLLHEMLIWLVAKCSIDVLLASTLPEGSGQAQEHETCCRQSKLPKDRTMVIGHHMDGAPMQKHESLEILSWNVPAIPWAERILFACIEKQFLCKCGCMGRHTVNAMHSILVWSLDVLFGGKHPRKRHDETDFTMYDGKCGRKKNAGEDIGCFARMIEHRGDWMALKQIFGFKGWSANSNMCWMCGADKGSTPYWDFSSKALWRASRYSTLAFMKLMHKNGISSSVLFEAPGFMLDFIMVDVLHCLDLGVAQEALGNLFFYFITSKVCPGSNRSQQILHLWHKIQAYYKEACPPTRIGKLTEEMVKQKSKKPRLRAKGSETRHLVPYGLVLASEIMEAGSTAFTRTLFNLFKHLNAFYNCMGQFPFNKELASNSARQFLLLYGELSRSTSEGLWTIKPKFHLFQELAEYKTYTSGDPSKFWSYADESFVGFVSKIAHSRGGPRLADTTPKNVMMKYRGMD